MQKKIPLLKDHHNHPSQYAALVHALNIQGTEDKDEALALIRDRDNDNDISVVIGWNTGKYDFTSRELDSLPPVIMCNLSLHDFVLNQGARDQLAEEYGDLLAQMDDKTWLERNLRQVTKMIIEQEPLTESKLGAFYSRLEGLGVWYAEDLSVLGAEEINIIRGSRFRSRTRLWATFDEYIGLDAEHRRYIHGIKLFTDGAIGAGTAALGQPYRDGGMGVLVHKDKELLRMLEQVEELGKAAAIHAIGDRATHRVVHAVERLRTKGQELPEVRMEHCQFISRSDALKAKDLGIVISMQPNFNYDSLDYRDRLPEPYLAQNNPFRMLIDQVGYVPGEDLVLGSDGMPHGAGFALQAVLFPPRPGQRLALEEFALAYCLEDMRQGHNVVEVDREREEVSVTTVLG